MKKIIVLILIIIFTPVCFANYTGGYFRKDGTYVRGHFKSGPNSTTLDNYSTRGRTNPYTLKRGSQSPYKYKYRYRYPKI